MSRGVFEFHTSSSFFPLFNSGKYICRNDRSELGVIREVNYAQTDKGERSAYCKGYFAEKLLDDRVLQAPVNISGTPEEIALALVDGMAIHPANSGRIIPRLVLGNLKGLGSRITLQTTGDKLGENCMRQSKHRSYLTAFYMTMRGTRSPLSAGRGLIARRTRKKTLLRYSPIVFTM